MDSEMETVMEMVTSMKEKVLDLETKVVDLKNKIYELESKNIKLEDQIYDLETKNIKLEDKVNDLKIIVDGKDKDENEEEDKSVDNDMNIEAFVAWLKKKGATVEVVHTDGGFYYNVKNPPVDQMHPNSNGKGWYMKMSSGEDETIIKTGGFKAANKKLQDNVGFVKCSAEDQLSCIFIGREQAIFVFEECKKYCIKLNQDGIPAQNSWSKSGKGGKDGKGGSWYGGRNNSYSSGDDGWNGGYGGKDSCRGDDSWNSGYGGKDSCRGDDSWNGGYSSNGGYR